jgi:putative hemolysin
MTFSRLWSNVAIPAVVAVLFALSVSAQADTYQIFNLGVANSNSVYGIDAAGDVVIRGSSFCGVFGYCYKT